MESQQTEGEKVKSNLKLTYSVMCITCLITEVTGTMVDFCYSKCNCW